MNKEHFRELTEAYTEIAVLLMHYREELLKLGFDREESFRMVIQMQHDLIANIKKRGED